MNLLLDTHVLLWWLDNPQQLSQASLDAISDTDNVVFVSAAVLWEIAIKRALGKLDVSLAGIEEGVNRSGFTPLPISGQHAFGTATLPPYHRDPFDRLLVSQSICEPATLVTRDPKLRQYLAECLEA